MNALDFMIGNLSSIILHTPTLYFIASVSDAHKIASTSPIGGWYFVILAVSFVIVGVIVWLIYDFAKKELDKTLNNIKKDENLRKSLGLKRRSQIRASQV